MPKLRNLTCSIQWADTGTAFQEYGTCYGDGVVETYIVVPDRPQPFTIHVTAQRFIHEGLAVLVFVDGHYQTNRIRVNLVPTKKGVPRERSELDLTIRQKEKSLGDGMYMGRAWRFDDHNIVPDLPTGVTDSHFDELGSIEVFVLRCSSRNVDETNESTTSSAAQSDILEALECGLEANSTTDDENDKKQSAKPKKAAAKPAKEEDDDDEALPFAGLFDGPSDYGRAPYPAPDPAFGHWDWPSHHRPYPQQRGKGPRHDGAPGGYGNAPYPGPAPSNVQNAHFVPEQYPRPPPADNHPPPFEKRVHFDYGSDQGPAADHARYWDGRERPSSYPRAPPHSNDKYYTPGLSEWYGSRSDGYDQGPRHGYVPHAYNIHNGAYGAYGHHQSGPPQYQYPPDHSGMQVNLPPPSPGAYAPWTGAQTAPPWSTHPVQGVSQAGSPRYYHPQAPPYQPYASTPYSTAAWGRPDGGQEAHGQGQDGFQNSGSLDPAKDANNANGTNQTGFGNKQDEWATDNDINNNTNDNNGNQSSGGWPGGDNSNNMGATNNGSDKNDENGGGDSNKGDNWADTTGNQDTTGWDTNNEQSDTTQGNWDNSNNNASNKAGGGDAWGDNSRKASATLPQTAGSSIRPLYGPHGAYYAMQFASASAPDIACDAEEEPRYDVPKPYVDDTGSTKQVQPGKGYLYYKKQCHPEYIDQLEEPYAKFVFLYMTKNQVEKELSINLDTEPSGNPEVQTFQDMNKDDLIQMLIRAKGALGGEIPPPPPAPTNPTEGAFIKGVPIEPPKQDFLGYDIPLRGGEGGGAAKGATTSTSGGNDGWGAPMSSTNNATNDSWETKPTDNNGNAAGGDWGSGANDWSNTNSGSGDKSDAHPKQQFPEESWAAAREQQKSGPLPAPPARPEPQANNAATGDTWATAPSGGAEAPAPGGGW